MCLLKLLACLGRLLYCSDPHQPTVKIIHPNERETRPMICRSPTFTISQSPEIRRQAILALWHDPASNPTLQNFQPVRDCGYCVFACSEQTNKYLVATRGRWNGSPTSPRLRMSNTPVRRAQSVRSARSVQSGTTCDNE